MNDRTLLERAAKASGIVGEYECWAGQGFMEGIRRKGDPKEFKIWNPLMYDDQAHRLESDLRLNVKWGNGSVTVGSATERYSHGDDPAKVKRRAIVRAAAEIGGE